MFSRTRCLSKPFVIDRTIISLFDVVSQIFVAVATRVDLSKTSATRKTPSLVQVSVPLLL